MDEGVWGFELKNKKWGKKKGAEQNKKYFDDVEIVYLELIDSEMKIKLSRIVRALLEIDDVLNSREVAAKDKKEIAA